jgi:protein required for attachment to host cells
MEEVDRHHLGKERFAIEVAEARYRRAHANRFDSLVMPREYWAIFARPFTQRSSIA